MRYLSMFSGIKKKPDGPRYKALGNSMAVSVMRWIAEQLERVLKSEG